MKTFKVQDKEIEFDEVKHKYYLDGRQLHGVTGISGMTAETGWMIPWTAKMCGEEVEKILHELDTPEEEIPEYVRRVKASTKKKSQKAIDFGNTCHSWLEGWIKFRMGTGDKPENPKSEKVKDAVRPFLEWEKENKPTYKASEEVVYFSEDDVDYAGTLDLRFAIDDVKSVGDIKTSARCSREMIYQLALYGLAVEQTHGEKVDELYIFRLPKVEDDSIEIKSFPFTDKLREAAKSLNYLKHLTVDIDLWLKK